jgi:hypothetical protein
MARFTANDMPHGPLLFAHGAVSYERAAAAMRALDASRTASSAFATCSRWRDAKQATRTSVACRGGDASGGGTRARNIGARTALRAAACDVPCARRVRGDEAGLVDDLAVAIDHLHHRFAVRRDRDFMRRVDLVAELACAQAVRARGSKIGEPVIDRPLP